MTLTQILRQDQIITAFLERTLSNLDKLYRDVTTALDNLVDAVGLIAA